MALRVWRPLAVLLTLLVLGACAADDPGSAAEGAGGETAAYPVSLTNKFGTTSIDKRPERVVAIGYNEQDFVLALGVTPVGVREFIGYAAAERPWARDLLPEDGIPTVGGEELDLEKIAALEPDVILGINSYIDEGQYELLSKIAPTVAQTDQYPDGATPWQEQTLTTGKVLGQESHAERLVDQTEQLFTDVVAQNPAFKGKEVAFALGADSTSTYELGADDYRSQWLIDLGFEVPDKGGEVSMENIAALDRDVLLAEGMPDSVLAMPVVQGLSAVRQGRFIDLGAFDEDFAAALGFNSPLSIPTLLDIAVPRLADATDSDPATVPAPFPAS